MNSIKNDRNDKELPMVLICTDRASRGIDFNRFNVSFIS